MVVRRIKTGKRRGGSKLAVFSYRKPNPQLLIPAFKLLGIPFSRIVISSVSEKSFLQADKRCMCESRNTQHQGVVSLSMPM